MEGLMELLIFQRELFILTQSLKQIAADRNGVLKSHSGTPSPKPLWQKPGV
jgi:hypothetical protein